MRCITLCAYIYAFGHFEEKIEARSDLNHHMTMTRQIHSRQVKKAGRALYRFDFSIAITVKTLEHHQSHSTTARAGLGSLPYTSRFSHIVHR